MDNELPEKIIDIDVVRANWNFKKHCTCSKRKFVLDPINREVHCSYCGEIVDPFDALMDLSNNYEMINSQLKSSLEQMKKIANYKPHLKVMKRLEKNYKGKNKMLPCCPVCNEPFYFEEITTWSGLQFGSAVIEKRKEENNQSK